MLQIVSNTTQVVTLPRSTRTVQGGPKKRTIANLNFSITFTNTVRFE